MPEFIAINGRELGFQLLATDHDDDGDALSLCPTCDGPITDDEEDAFGVCTDCLH